MVSQIVGNSYQIKTNGYINNNYARPVSFRANTTQTDTLELSNAQQTKSLSKGAKYGIGAVALLGLGALAYVLTKGKVGSKQVQSLAEHIEFKPATTMDEAVKFAKEHLGITKFDVGNDLEIANWVNNGLTKVSNRYKGKAPIPSIVETYPEALYQQAMREGKDVAMADINAHTGKMRVNTHYFNDAKKTIQECMDAMEIKVGKADANGHVNFQFGLLPFMNMKKQTDLMPLLVKVAEGNASKMEIVTCEMAISDMLHFQNILCEKPELLYGHVLKSSKLKNILNSKKNIDVLSLDKFKTLTKEKQVEYLYNLNHEVIKGKTGDDLLNVFSEIRIADRRPDVHYVIDHEMGHALHLQSLGAKEYKARHLLSDSEKNIATTVSDYATTNSHEFVAEVHAELIEGHAVSPEVMALYKKYGGVIPA